MRNQRRMKTRDCAPCRERRGPRTLVRKQDGPRVDYDEVPRTYSVRIKCGGSHLIDSADDGPLDIDFSVICDAASDCEIDVMKGNFGSDRKRRLKHLKAGQGFHFQAHLHRGEGVWVECDGSFNGWCKFIVSVAQKRRP